MRSLFENADPPRVRITTTAGLSIALHALILALIIAGSIRVRHAVIFRPIVQGAVQQIAVVAVSPGNLAAVLAPQHPATSEKLQPPRHKSVASSQSRAGKTRAGPPVPRNQLDRSLGRLPRQAMQALPDREAMRRACIRPIPLFRRRRRSKTVHSCHKTAARSW